MEGSHDLKSGVSIKKRKKKGIQDQRDEIKFDFDLLLVSELSEWIRNPTFGYFDSFQIFWIIITCTEIVYPNNNISDYS